MKDRKKNYKAYARKATSTYKTRKSAKWQQQQPQDQQKDRHQSLDACTYCGGRGSRNHARKHCPAREVECHDCGKIGHYKRVCRNKGRPGSPQEGGDAAARSVGTAEVQGHDGSDPTPIMKNVKVIPHNGGRPFKFDMLPDTWCTQSLMAADLASYYGMVVNTRQKKGQRSEMGLFWIGSIQHRV